MPASPRFFATPESFRRWLAEHHAQATELVVGFYKRGSGKPSITWPESVDEALCFGWIDGVRRSLSDEAYCIRFTPRKASSNWSAVNVARIAELDALGKLTDAGRRAFAARKAERTGVYSHERNAAAVLSPADARRLRDNAAAAAFLETQPPWYRRTATHWVISAKREETRQRRLDQLIADSAAERWITLATAGGRQPSKKPAVAAQPAAAEPSRVAQGAKKKAARKRAPKV
jgi:uncharacterized protein YdeI (YjbR/CyaY-like superfamily)